MIEELQRFVLASKEGNITRTAERIFITQSALSQSIKRLETELGTKLFIQKGKGLALTEDGKAVADIATRILQLWNNAKDPQVRSVQADTYTVGLFDNAALLLGDYLQRSINEKAYNLELHINASGRLFSQLHWGILDAAICVIDERTEAPKTISLVGTFQEELLPVSSKRFTMPIASMPFVLYNQGSNTRQQIDRTFTEKGIKPTIFAESTSTTFMKELATLGGGIALLPSNFVASELKQGILKKQKLPFKIYRSYGLYIQNEGKLSRDDVIIQTICRKLRR